MWERIVYGSDHDDKPLRSASIASSSQNQLDTKALGKDEDTVRAIEKEVAPEAPSATDISRSTWNPSLFHPRAFAGVGSLCVTICCVFASLAILVVSDGQNADSWPISPTVYLAIVAAISNSAVRLGHFHSVPISWWYHASRGSSIRALERHWEINNSVARAIFHSRHLSLLNLACVAVSLAVIDGPFLQRASTVVLTTRTTNVILEIPIPGELPTGFCGYYQDHVLNQTPQGNATIVEFLHREPIKLDVAGCDGRVRISAFDD